MAEARKSRVSKRQYMSQTQKCLPGFETPFEQHLDASNRWVLMSQQIPWDNLVKIYESTLENGKTGAKGINARVVLGAIMIKHILNLSDRETVQHIQ